MYVVPGTELVPVSRSCYYTLNASIEVGRQQAGKSGSEVASAQRVILCVFISAALFHWSHKRKWTQRTVGRIRWFEEGTSLKPGLLKLSK